MLDIRQLDTGDLLRSASLEDNVIAVLTRSGGSVEAIREILARISKARAEDRNRALVELTLLASLRRLETVIEQETNHMPVLGGVLDNKVLGREYKRGLKTGIEKGMEKGERTLVAAQLRKRFGSLPTWAEEALSRLNADQLEQVALRLLDVRTLEEVLG